MLNVNIVSAGGIRVWQPGTYRPRDINRSSVRLQNNIMEDGRLTILGDTSPSLGQLIEGHTAQIQPSTIHVNKTTHSHHQKNTHKTLFTASSPNLAGKWREFRTKDIDYQWGKVLSVGADWVSDWRNRWGMSVGIGNRMTLSNLLCIYALTLKVNVPKFPQDRWMVVWLEWIYIMFHMLHESTLYMYSNASWETIINSAMHPMDHQLL